MTQSPDPRHWHEVPGAPAPGTWLAARAALPDGAATMQAVDGFPVLLLRSGAEVKAYVNRCAHFGVPLAARQDLLIYQPHTSVTCNVHYARYRWSDGRCESGECDGEGLLPIPLTIHADGAVHIATDVPPGPAA